MEAYMFIMAVTILVCCVYLLIKLNQHDGKMVVTTTEEGKTIFTLELEGDPADLVNKKSISFKVDSSTRNG